MAIVQYPSEWEDILPSGISSRASGPSIPSTTNWGRGTYAYEYQSGVTSLELYSSVQFYHGCKQGLATISPHIHCAIQDTITPSNTITFNFLYTYASIGSQFPATQTLTATYWSANTVSSFSHIIIESQDLAVTITPSSIMDFIIKRPNDNYGSSVWLLSFDVHAQFDSRGSQQEYTK